MSSTDTHTASCASMNACIRNIQVLLKVLFGLVPIVAGADKFTNLLTNWESYLAPQFTSLLPLSATSFMHVVGVIEIVAGILVFAKTRLGAYIVTAWLLAIALQLIVQGQYFDVAVRDIVLALGGAWTLARLTPCVEKNAA